jgi:preprotein translocase subunit SecD
MKNRRSLWVSLLAVVAIAVVGLFATIAAGWSPKLGLDLDGGLSVVYQTHTPVNSGQLDTIVTILGNRVNAGTTGATVNSQGNNQISVSIPGEKNSQQILSTLGNTAQLLFRPVLCYAVPYQVPKGHSPSTGPIPTCASSNQLTAANIGVKSDSSSVAGYTSNLGSIPADTQFATYPTTLSSQDNKTATVILPSSPPSGANSNCAGRCVLGPAQVTGTDIKSASANLVNGQWVVNINFTGEGATKWDALAQQQFHALIGMDLDGAVISAPITQPTQATFTSFNGNVQVSGNFTEDSAKTLATDLTYGALPVKLDRLTVETVSPTLGKASLQAGLISGLVGLLVVMLYMIFYYRLLGLVVISGLALTGALLWTIIALLGQSAGITIDLAGVIGVVVAIGITVDSYIVYFERLKDETRAGRTVRTSVDRGFHSAFRTVLAADAVSLLGAIVLYELSIGPVQGFALFLGISTILDVFVTYFFTRPFVILLGRSRAATEARTMGVASGLGVTAEARI